MIDPFDRVVALLEDVRETSKGVRARCPVHEVAGSTPSLDVDRGADGTPLFQCRSAKCSTEAILAKLGLEKRDLFRDRGQRARAEKTQPAKPKKPPQRYSTIDALTRAVCGFSRYRDGKLTTFDYYDAAGAHVYRALRFDFIDGTPKAFSQAHFDGSAWLNTGMEHRPLYRLPELLAADPDEPVIVVEGEKCADAVAALPGGFVVTTSSQGAESHAKSDWQPLAARHVCNLPDDDDEGRKYRDAVANHARTAGATSVSVLELQGLADGEDVVDWIAARERDGRTREQIAAELRDLVLMAPSMVEADATAAEPSAPPAEAVERVPFPVDVLPPVLRRLVAEGAAAHNVDAAFFGVPLLSVLAGAIGASRRVLVRDGWHEPCIVWTGVVAPSGAGKSPPLDVLLRPMRERDEDLLRRSQIAHDDFKARLADWTRAQRRKEGDDSGAAPEPPPRLCCLVDDVTTEALAVRLAENPRGVTLAADELATWLGGFDAYRGGRGGDEAKWLGMHGARPLKVDRKGGGTLYVPAPHVSVCGGVQPRVAARLLGRAQRESGLAARLLLAVPPTRAATWTEDRVSLATVEDYGRVVRSLLDLQTTPDPIALRLSSEALNLFIPAHDKLAEAGAAAAAAGDEDTAAAAAKIRSAVPRIALVLALARAAETGIAELLREIGAESMAAAIVLGEFFAAEARKLYGAWQADEGDPIVGKVAAAIRAAGRAGATRTEIRDALGRNARAEQVEGALAALAKQGLAERVPVSAGIGRPPERWRVAG